MDEKSIEAAAIAIARVDLPRSFASLKGKRLEEAVKIEANWQPYVEHARASIAAYRDAEIERLTAKIEAWETAIDSWMVVNWIGVYDSEKGVSETLSLCLERALDVERDALRAKLEAAERRLDWLEQMANAPGGLLLHDGSETGRTGLGLRPGTLVRTLRQAIDDAARGGEG